MAEEKKKKKRKYDDHGDKLCPCGLLEDHGGPCGQPRHSRNSDAIPFFNPEEEKKEEESS